MLFKTDIALASAGDQIAVANLTNNLRPRLTKMAAFYARNTGEDAEDLLQEAYLGLLDALAKVDLSIGDPEQFLLKHARWRLLDAAKRWRRRRHDQIDEERVDLEPCTEWDSEVSEIWVDDFVRQLKPTQQAILRYLLVGMTWREAGDGLGCSSANVAYHVRQIQKTYEQWSGEQITPRSGRAGSRADKAQADQFLEYDDMPAPTALSGHDSRETVVVGPAKVARRDLRVAV